MEHQIKQLLLLLQAPVLLIAPFFAFSIQSERVCPLPEYECAQVYYYYCYYLWSPFTSIDREAVVQKKEEIEMQSALHEIGALPALSSNLLLVSRRGKWPEIFALFSLLLSVDKLITYRGPFLVNSLLVIGDQRLVERKMCTDFFPLQFYIVFSRCCWWLWLLSLWSSFHSTFIH